MEYRLEFGDSRSESFRWILRLCKKLPSFTQTVDEGLNVYTVTFTEKQLRGMRPILGYMADWSKAILFVGGEMHWIHDVLDQLEREDTARHNDVMTLRMDGHKTNSIVDVEPEEPQEPRRGKRSANSRPSLPTSAS